MNCFRLFLCFLQVGLFSVGGGYAAIPLIESGVVDANGWLTMQEFANLVTIAEMTPGPIAINAATFVGMRIAGLPGALTATFGCILPSCIIVSLLSRLYHRQRENALFQHVLSSMRPVIVALIASAAVSIFWTAVSSTSALSFDRIRWFDLVLVITAFLVLRIKRWNPILVMALCGVAELGFQMLVGGPA